MKCLYISLLCAVVCISTGGATSIPQNENNCPANHFGDSCERECHCLVGTCDVSGNNVTCQYGCARGWLGPSCDIERVKPEIKYYCIGRDSAYTYNKVPYFYISLKTNGLERVFVSPFKNGERDGDCHKVPQRRKNRKQGENDKIIGEQVSTIRVNAMPYAFRTPTHYCELAAEDPENTTYSLLVSVKEKSSINLDYDLDAVLRCNFSESDLPRAVEDVFVEHNGARKRRFKSLILTPNHIRIPRESHRFPVAPSSLSDDVSLTLVGVDGEEVNQSVIGTPVRLRLTFGQTEGSPLEGLQTRYCLATTLEPKPSRTVLSYQDGCFDDVVPKFEQTSNSTMETGYFPLFSLSGKQAIQFKCYFDLCFEKRKCKPLCTETHLRRRRETADDEPLESVDNLPVASAFVSFE